MSIIMGTAGHVDHGKTCLVKALTGEDCDRLKEEKVRGITIELGFASLRRPDGETIAIIDVPGHERFIKQMVAGTAGIDCVLFVVAADEGIMPQTREHLEICSLLGIQRGLIALTKIDRIDREWLALVTTEVQTFFRGSFLGGAPIVQVSSNTGEGIGELKQVIYDVTAKLPGRRGTDLPRLPVDRVFSVKGHGTVATGTLLSGKLTVGETLEVMPSGVQGRVKMLQSYGQEEQMALAGFRTAVNMHGLSRDAIRRGEVLSKPGRLFASPYWIVNLYCLPSSSRPLKDRMTVHFHHAAKEVQAQLLLTDRGRLMPGDSTLAQVCFPEPMLGVFADHFVIRSGSPLRTVGGGEVLYPLFMKIQRRSPGFQNIFRLLQRLSWQAEVPDAKESLLIQVELTGNRGATFAELCIMVNLPSTTLRKALDELIAEERVFGIDKNNSRIVSAACMADYCESLVEWLDAFHKAEPSKAGINKGAVFSGWGKDFSEELTGTVLKFLQKQGKVKINNDIVSIAGYAVSQDPALEAMAQRILKHYEGTGESPMNLPDVLQKLSLTHQQAKNAFRLLIDLRKLAQVGPELYFPMLVIDDFRERISHYFSIHLEMGPGDFRAVIGLSRRYCAALMEYFDTTGVTQRKGRARVKGPALA